MVRRLDRFLAAMLGELAPAGIVWARIGIIVLVVAAAMSFDFGFDVSWKHAVFLAVLTFVAAFGPEVAHKAWQEGKRGAALVVAVVCAPLLGIEFYSHAGYTAGLRGHNLAEARVANVKYDGAQDSVREGKANLELWSKQLATLTEQHAWAPTVKAEGLRAQLDAAQKAIDLEAARGGCKSKCQALMADKGKLEERIAIAERATDLTARIEATKRLLDGARAKADATEHKSSAVAHQNQFLARAVALVGYRSLQPTATIEEATAQSTSLAMAVVGTGLPAFAFFVAGLYRVRRREFVEELAPPVSVAAVAAAGPPPAQPPIAPPVFPPPVPASQPLHTREIVRTDRGVWRELNAALNPIVTTGRLRAAGAY
jgi:hypothetical protein